MRKRYVSRCPVCDNHESRMFSDARAAAEHATTAAAEHNDDLPDPTAGSIIPPNRRVNGAYIEVVFLSE